MTNLRRNAKRGAIVLLALALAAGLFLFIKVYNETSTPPAAAGVGPGGSSSDTGAAPSPGLSSTAGNGVPGSSETGLLSSFPSALTKHVGKHPNYLKPVSVTLEVTSQGRLMVLGYLVPTSDTPIGSKRKPLPPWSKTVQAYGTKYLAGIFIQNGSAGYPVTCRILFDGVLKNEQTFSGAYKRGLCIA